MAKPQLLLAIVSLWTPVLLGTDIANAEDAHKIVFARDIASIFAAHCYQCHGPESTTRKSDVRLDQLDLAISRSATDEEVINPGRPELSSLFQRISSNDPESRMPPPSHGPGLTPAQIDTLRSWIQQGAPYSRHWSFVPPLRPDLPEVTDRSWPRSPIDFFILNKLESRGLRAASVADRNTLLRRISLDLTGLPPTIGEIERFSNDESPTYWGRLIDRMLSSPRYGERLAQPWLDAARYADTTGHAADQPRNMWLFRDWVIDAFNTNMPFDQFTIEQLAGDMLPNATKSQLIATGFHRNSMQALGNNPRKEEFRVKGIVDRLDTTGRVWLGLTIGCAECHDHKYDPLTQKEYYQLFAVFNNVPHYGERFGVHGPRIEVLPADTKFKIAALTQRLRHRESVWSRKEAHQSTTDVAQIRSWAGDLGYFLSQQQPVLHIGFPGRIKSRTQASLDLAPTDYTPSFDESAFVGAGPRPDIAALTLKKRQALAFDASVVPKLTGDFAIGMWINTSQECADLVTQYDWKSGKRSYVFGIGGQGDRGSQPGKLYAWLSERPEEFHGPIVYGSIPVNDGKWHHVAVSYAAGKSITLYVDGQPDSEAKVHGSFPLSVADASLPLVIGGGFNNADRPNDFFINGQIADVRIFDRPLTGRQLGAISEDEYSALHRFATSDSSEPALAVRQLYAEIKDSCGIDEQLHRLSRRIDELKRQTVTAQVMEEMAEARQTFVHVRGDFENLGEPVEPSVPHVLSGAISGLGPVNRLALAKSLVDSRNPLTARVIVNRIWKYYFGNGLVGTLDDFGVRGEFPSHPRLLDWLAVEFMECGWDMKNIHRLILSSATYRQSSDTNSRLRDVDPNNRLLARGPRARLEAEQIRDVALFASGQLVERIGGPSVFPLQDASIGQYRDETAGKWLNSPGPGQYRRAIYTFWQRMSPYPSMVIFDAPSRERCTVGRSQTNTPLQALTALNDPYLALLARRFGQRIQMAAESDTERIQFAFLIALSRPPELEELKAFLTFVDSRDDDETWFRVAQVLLNLDEAITKD